MPIEFQPPPMPNFQIPGPQYTDPLQTLAQMQQMKTQRLQQQNAQLAQQEAQLNLDQRKAINAAYQGAFTPQPDGSVALDTDKLSSALATSGHGEAIPGILENYTKYRQSAATLQETNQKNAAAEADAAGNLGATVQAANNDPNVFHTLISDAVNRKIITPAHFAPFDQAITQSLQTDPTGNQARAMVKQFTDQFIAGSPKQRELANTTLTATSGAAEKEATTAKTKSETAGQQRQQAIADIQTADLDPQTGTPTPAAWAGLLTKYPNAGLPESAPSKAWVDRFIRSGVAPKEQPEFDIKAAQADALRAWKSGKTDDLYKQIDLIVPPNDPMNGPTKALMQAAIAKGSFDDVQKVLKDAYDQQGRTATAVRTARETVPFKVEVGKETAIARADAAGLTDDDYQRAGEQYARTGIMPSMGRDSITRGRIAHNAQQWARDNGFSPADMVTMQAAYAGDKESLKKFQAQRDQIVSFEQTAQKNLDLFLGLAAKIPDTGVPWLNSPLRNLNQSMVGSENMAAVNAARQIANNEIAKVTSGGGLGGTLSDSARHEVAGFNPDNATFKQTKAVAAILKADMANRHQSMDATLSDIKSRIGGGTGTPAGLPKGNGRAADSNIIKQFLDANGGNKDATRKALTDNGWTIPKAQ